MLFSWHLVGGEETSADPKITSLLVSRGAPWFVRFPVGYLGDARRRAGMRSDFVSCWSNVYNHAANSHCNSAENIALSSSPRPGQDLSEQGCAKGFLLNSRCLVRPVWPGRQGFRKPGLLLALQVSRHAHWYQVGAGLWS